MKKSHLSTGMHRVSESMCVTINVLGNKAARLLATCISPKMQAGAVHTDTITMITILFHLLLPCFGV